MYLYKLLLAAPFSLKTALLLPLNPSISLLPPSNVSLSFSPSMNQTSRPLTYSNWPTHANIPGNLCISFVTLGRRADSSLTNAILEAFAYINSEIAEMAPPEALILDEDTFRFDWLTVSFSDHRVIDYHPLTFGQASQVVDKLSLFTKVYGGQEIVYGKISRGGCRMKHPLVGNFFVYFGIIPSSTHTWPS